MVRDNVREKEGSDVHVVCWEDAVVGSVGREGGVVTATDDGGGGGGGSLVAVTAM